MHVYVYRLRLMLRSVTVCYLVFFFFNATAPTEIYTLSLHDAFPISVKGARRAKISSTQLSQVRRAWCSRSTTTTDRKSTRLNSSHSSISYAVFCLKKKNKILASIFVLSSLPIFNAHTYYAQPVHTRV